jgi:hypothetical protein
MRAFCTALVLVVVPGCGSTSVEPEAQLLTTVEMIPGASVLSTMTPLNTVTFLVVAHDQHGYPMADAVIPGLASANNQVARVSDGLTVAAVAQGETEIAASVTVRGVTRTASAKVTVVASREPVLVGTWRGIVAGSLGTSNVVVHLNADGSMSTVGDASWTRCRTEGTWELAGDEFVASVREVECGTPGQLAFFAPLSGAQHLSGSWGASTGPSGTFSFRKD